MNQAYDLASCNGTLATTHCGNAHEAAEQGDEADEAFGGTNPRAASGAQPEVPPNARAAAAARGHRFARAASWA